MAKKSTSSAVPAPDRCGDVFGTVRDAYQRPLKGAHVEVFDQQLRSQKRLGSATRTNEAGFYHVRYELNELEPEDKGAADVVVRVLGSDEKLLAESSIHYNAPAKLQVDIDLSSVAYPGLSEFERVLEQVRGAAGKVPLSELTQDTTRQDISFLTGRTGLTPAEVSALAMAYRFEKDTGLEAVAYYGLLRHGPTQKGITQPATTAPSLSFDDQAAQAFATLMQQPIAALISGIQAAIDSNIIPYAVTADLPKVERALEAELAAYQKTHPQPSSPSTLTQKLSIAGLEGAQVAAFTGLFSKSAGTTQTFWDTLAKNPAFQQQQVSLLQAVFTLSRLTGEQLVLTDQLVKATGITAPADLTRLAAHSAQDWLKVLNTNKVQPPAGTPGATPGAQLNNYASELEANFTAAFPSAAFTARLSADPSSLVPQGIAIAQFLQANPTFDLLTTRIGQHFAANPPAPGTPAAAPASGPSTASRRQLTGAARTTASVNTAFVNQLKRTQRIFKLAPTYAATNALLGAGIDSAQKIYRMGPGNFLAKYGPTLGTSVASDIFQKARQAYSHALMLIGNLKSVSDASVMQVFPDYTQILSSTLTVEVPDLDTLFGHTDFCECDECNSVEGAPAYLADALHYLDNRLTSITSGSTTASVKQALGVRRPDIEDLDLSCDNTNVEVPYIDIANELLEDFILPPVISLAASYLPLLTKGTINAGLQGAIVAAFNAGGFTNVAALLTPSASVSSPYTVNRLQSGGTFVTENRWIIRDDLVVLKATQQPSGLSVQLTHQTLLSEGEISANPEYTNIPAYDALKAVKRPFALPFDLFDNEGQMYLDKLGTPKADLIDAFREEHEPAITGLPAYPLSSAPTQSDLDMAYTDLGVNAGERALIFQQDLLGQTTYWGSIASGTSPPLDEFMAATSLTYEEVLQLLTLTSINPAKDSVISSPDLTCDTSSKTITNLTPAKFDIIHRFLRLWRKTTLTLVELDAVVQSPALGNGVIGPALAPQLQWFLALRALWSLSAFQCLALYQNLDTQAPDNLYDSLFKNRAATNPLNPDFAVSQVTSATPVAITTVHQGLIMGALGLGPLDLATLISQTDGKLSLRNLSYFFRMAQLSQALSVSIDDLFKFLALINLAPVTAATTAALPSNPVTSDPIATHQFLQMWNAVVTSQLSASDLDYVLRYQSDATASNVPADDDIAQALGDLQTKLLKVQTATTVTADPAGTLLKQWLTDPVLGWNPALVAKLLDILGTQDDTEFQQKVDNNDDFLLNLRIQYLDGTLTAPLATLPATAIIPDTLASQVSYDAANRQLVLIGNISATNQGTLVGLSMDPAWQGAVNQLYADQTTPSTPGNTFFTTVADINTKLKALLQTKVPQRYALFLAAIAPVYNTLLSQGAVQTELCSWFQINKDVAATLEQSQPGIFTDFTSAPFVNRANALTAANYPAQFTWYRKLALVCFVTTRLRLAAGDLQWLLPKATQIGSLDLWNLPTSPVAGPATTFPAFQVLVNILTFNQQFPPVTEVTTATTSTVSLYSVLDDIIGGAATPTVEAALTTLTGWDSGALDALINAPNLLNLTLTPPPSDLLSVRVLLRLTRAFQIMRGLGAAPSDCVAWTKPSLTYDDAVKIKQALQAKTGADQWLTVTQPLQNTLRQNKRDALVAYLIANPPAGQIWSSSDDLYSYFLIDVEMCSCQPTSRIIQATNSVQQFVQRLFLNLEADIRVDLTADPDWSQWEWMKNYRVWQANREIFLYPENYIEPELLPAQIKSSFFSDLQNNLLQNDVTNDNVQSAFLTYLDRLDEVARLEIKAVWYEDQKKILHVVGRTYGGSPRTYYYRQLINEMRWTPWVKIDQDVASDHVVLTVFNHRVYLFWALFQENSDDVSSVSVPSAGDSSFSPSTAEKYWQIQLAFTEYKNGKWTPKKVSSNGATGTITYYQNWDGSSWSPTRDQFLFTPLDVPQLNFKKYFDASGKLVSPNTFLSTLLQDVIGALESNGDLIIRCYLQTSPGHYQYVGSFDLDPCKGYPVVISNSSPIRIPLFDQSSLSNMLDLANSQSEALAVNGGAILGQTRGQFDNLVSLQMGFIDRLIDILYQILYRLYYKPGEFAAAQREGFPVTVGTFMPYVYQDKSYTYYVRPEFSDNAGFEFTYQDLEDLILALLEGNSTKAHEILATFPRGATISLMQHFFNLYHPLACFFMRTLFDSGLDALMSRETQLKNDVIFDPSPGFDFKQIYAPTNVVYSGQPIRNPPVTGPIIDPTPGYPKGDVDFTPLGAYSLYNWELFFHAPLMIARRLDQNLQFEAAEHWFRYIFNPTDGSTYPSPDKYWVTKPFFENVNDKYWQQNINNIMLGIDSGNQALVQDVTDWRNNPFQPHYIAQYRTVAYQKTTVMKYLDHLIAWGDNLFRQDTMESVMEAEQLYVLASQILGPKPLIIPESYELPIENYDQLQQNIDAFSNAMVDVENLLPLQQIQGYNGVNPTQGMPVLATLYFCIPPNSQLLEYWDTVADRLYKIRHCLNLQGQLAPLALMAPKINPMLLVRAAAAGLDIGSVLTDLNSPLPNYRFSVMIQKAIEICNEAKSLGASLLQTMEKKDAEDVALLRSKNGIALLNAVLTLKKSQVQDATHNVEALQAQQALIQVRINYYTGLINAGLSAGETAAANMTQSAIAMESAAVQIEYLGNVLALIPDFDLGASGFGGSPLVAAKFGGTQLGGATRAMAAAIRGVAGVTHSQAGVASTQAGYQRRLAEWQFQLNLANAEMAQLQRQLLAAQVRLDIANQDVTNQQLQITNAQAEDDFMHQKFTNTDLYAWMIGQLSQLYFQAYQLAYAWAKQAEQTFRYELGVADSNFIVFGYWNSLQKGLLAADGLMSGIRSMDKAYHDQNAREYELTKHISLSQLDPAALELLRTTGSCWFTLPEELFDLDYPGYYMRRVRSVSLTLPCVAGPYTTVSCKLTMTRNSVRVSSTSTGASTYPRKLVSGAPADDPRFRDSVGAIQSIATSSGQNDSGLFELNFRDDRYLPFECAGAISQWHLELPAPYPQFDYRTLADVIVHLKYTARDGGATLASDASTNLKTRLNSMIVGLAASDSGLMRAFSVRHEFPAEWYAFLNPPAAGADQEMDLDITADRFPYFASVSTIKIKSIELIADTTLTHIDGITVTPVPTNTPLNLIQDNAYSTLPRLVLKYSGQSPGSWVIKNPAANPRLTAAQLTDLMVIVHYNVS